MKAIYALAYFYLLGIGLVIAAYFKHFYIEIPIAVFMIIAVSWLCLTRPRLNG